MNSTEDLLTGALDAAAETVRPQRLRPLPGPEHRTQVRPRRWDARLAPAAAAAVVVLVVALALVVTSGHQRSAVSRAAGGGSATLTAPPRYYAEAEGGIYTGSSQVVVRSTASGAVVARIANPPDASGAGPRQYAIGVVAAPGDRTFYAVYESGNTRDTSIRIYRFRVGSSGAPTVLTGVPGGLITGQHYLMNTGGLAVSPDGSQLALAVAAIPSDQGASGLPEEIVVVNLRTGAHRVWTGGLARAGAEFNLASVSWTGDGESLVYLAQWCYGSGTGNGMTGVTCITDRTDAQVREIDATSGGGLLNSGAVLLRQSATHRYIAQALINPAGDEITAVVQEGSHLDVAEISVATGKTVKVLYRLRAEHPELGSWHLAADSTGQYLLFAEGGSGPVHGWVKAGTLRPLPPLTGGFGDWDGFTW